jgi:hypothetical protein
MMDDDFLWWLGYFGTYMKAEHGVDLVKEITPLKGKLGPETIRYLYGQYKRGKTPKGVADFLIDHALNGGRSSVS